MPEFHARCTKRNKRHLRHPPTLPPLPPSWALLSRRPLRPAVHTDSSLRSRPPLPLTFSAPTNDLSHPRKSLARLRFCLPLQPSLVRRSTLHIQTPLTTSALLFPGPFFSFLFDCSTTPNSQKPHQESALIALKTLLTGWINVFHRGFPKSTDLVLSSATQSEQPRPAGPAAIAH